MTRTLFSLSFLFVYSAIFIGPVLSANDWSSPCNGGWCEYTTGDGKSSAYTTLIINGPTSAISDITPANGFKIGGCDRKWGRGAHKISLNCVDRAKCKQLFDGGAADTIVRLPESCGAGPFARISKLSAKRLAVVAPAPSNHTEVEERAEEAEEWDVTLSYDMTNVNAQKLGTVSMFLAASNVKGESHVTRRHVSDSLVKRGSGRELSLHKRGLFSDIINAISDAVNTIVDIVKGVGQIIGIIDDIIDDRKNPTAFNRTEQGNLPPLSVHRNFPILDKTLNCGALQASLSLDVDANVEARVAYGVTAIGTIVPPALEDFKIFATLSGNLSAAFNVEADVTGRFDTGVLTLWTYNLPGISVPGIINIGPQFVLNSELVADLDVQARITVNTGFNLPGVNLVFPPRSGNPSNAPGTAPISNASPLTVQLGSASGNATGVVAAHLIPTIEFGIDALGGIAEAEVFLELDAVAQVAAQVEAKVRRNEESRILRFARRIPPSEAVEDAAVERRAITAPAASGAFALDGAIFITAGAKAHLLDIWNDNVKLNIFTYTKRIVTKAFGNGDIGKLVIPKPTPAPKGSKSEFLSCALNKQAVSITEGAPSEAKVVEKA